MFAWSSFRSAARVLPLSSALLVILALGIMVLTGCGEDIPFGPRITNMDVAPSTLDRTETGMTDQYFDVTVETAGFEGEFDTQASEVFIQRDNGTRRPAVPEEGVEVIGDTLVFRDIAQAWFEGFSAGEHNIGATIVTDTESVTQLDLATVTVIDSPN